MIEIIRVSNFLRNILLLDAVSSIATALLLTLGANFLQTALGLSGSLLFYVGLSLFPFIALLIYAATRKSISKTLIWLIIGLNLLWAVDCVLLLVSGFVAPTTFGYVFVIFQAIGVIVLADLEFIGLKKSEVVVFKDAKETI